MENSTFELQVIKAIIENGGTADDILLFNEQTAKVAGFQIARAARKHQLETQVYVVEPVNDLKANLDKFQRIYDFKSKNRFMKEPVNPKINVPSFSALPVTFISLDGDGPDDIAKQIDEKGFVFAPTPYVVGLGIQYPEVYSKYHKIRTLKEKTGLEWLSVILRKLPNMQLPMKMITTQIFGGLR